MQWMPTDCLHMAVIKYKTRNKKAWQVQGKHRRINTVLCLWISNTVLKTFWGWRKKSNFYISHNPLCRWYTVSNSPEVYAGNRHLFEMSNSHARYFSILCPPHSLFLVQSIFYLYFTICYCHLRLILTLFHYAFQIKQKYIQWTSEHLKKIKKSDLCKTSCDWSVIFLPYTLAYSFLYVQGCRY
jgi:hypothetical protein